MKYETGSRYNAEGGEGDDIIAGNRKCNGGEENIF